MNRDIGRDRWASGRQRLEDQHCVQALEPAAAERLVDVDRAHAKRGRAPDHVDRKMFLLIPLDRMRRQLLVGEGASHFAYRQLLLVEREQLPGLGVRHGRRVLVHTFLLSLSTIRPRWGL